MGGELLTHDHASKLPSTREVKNGQNDAYRKSTIMLKVSDNCISRVDLYFVPGPTRGGYIVQIREVPRSISIAQLIVFFGKRIKRKVSTSHRYDFDFSEL